MTADVSLAALANRANEEHRAYRKASRSVLQHARAAGEALNEAKATVQHGAWLDWLKANFEASSRTAQMYMRVARDWEELEEETNPKRVADLSLRAAIRLLSQAEEGEPDAARDNPRREYRGMPDYRHQDFTPYASITVHLPTKEALEDFSDLVGQNLNETTDSIWHPEAPIRRMVNKQYRVPRDQFDPERHAPKYPIYVPSKGRADNATTPDVLEDLGVEHQIVVEPDEVEEYAERFGRERLIVLPEDLEPGLHTTRTWIKRYCIRETGADRHWQIDDNIQGFHRYNDNLKTPVADPTVIRVMEDFVDRYENVALAGPRYFMFVTRKDPGPPITLNSRIYSCTLVNNAIPHEWELRYNDDTDISLRVLKDGWTTVLFNSFLQYKTTTMEMSGGLTEEYEAMDDRREFAEMLARRHPEVVEVTRKFGRFHHDVDYSPFKANRLEKRPGVDLEEMPATDDYGMELYVDGERVARDPEARKEEAYFGRAPEPLRTTGASQRPEGARR